MNKNRKMLMQMFGNPNTQTTLLTALSDEMKTFYDKTLITLAGPKLVHDQFGQTKNIPQNGGKTIEFRKYDSLPKAMTPLTEGVTPDGQNMNVTNIEATVSQYGGYITISDVLKMTAIDNNVTEALKLLADQAGRTLDSVTRDVLAGGTSVNYSGGRTSRAALTDSDKLKVIDIEKAATQLAAANAPTFEDGSYVAIIHPYTSFDLRTSSEWIDVHKYTDQAVNKMFEGEIGKIGNVRFVATTEAKIWKSAADNCPSYTEGGETLYKAVFSTLVLGANAYGKTSVEGGGLQTIVKQLGAGDDPLNQRATVGWKAIKTAERLVEQYMVRIESLSAYSIQAAAN